MVWGALEFGKAVLNAEGKPGLVLDLVGAVYSFSRRDVAGGIRQVALAAGVFDFVYDTSRLYYIEEFRRAQEYGPSYIFLSRPFGLV